MPKAHTPISHGGLDRAELRQLGLRPEEVLDFSANIGPLPLPPVVMEAMRRVDVTRYPDPESTELREAISSAAKVRPENILVGNGSTELIVLVARAFLEKDSRVVIFTPTFSEYEVACQTVGAAISHITAEEKDTFRWDIAAARRQLSRSQPRLLFLCNPNNPTGVYLSKSEVQSLVEGLPETVVVLDEAFITYPTDPWDSANLLHRGHVILLRSMTKDFAIPGLRLGYAVADPVLIRAMAAHQPRWSVNALAQAAGLAALGEREYLRRLRQTVAEGREFLTKELRALGLEVVPSETNFVLVRVSDATAVRRSLLRDHRIGVRDCTSFGLPQYIRVAVRTLPECQRLVSALKGLL